MLVKALPRVLSLLIVTVVARASESRDISLFRIPFVSGFDTPPAISVIYDLDYTGLGSAQPHAVIACFWPDGRAVWSQNQAIGGPPYFSGFVDPKRIQRLIELSEAKGIFAKKLWYSVGLDCPHHDINLIDGSRRVTLMSTGCYMKQLKTPDPITSVRDAFGYLRRQIEHLLPERGQIVQKLNYELRKIP